jgi:nucleoside-diphosphate-sugar epimerase
MASILLPRLNLKYQKPQWTPNHLELPIQTLTLGSQGRQKALELAKHKEARFLLALIEGIYRLMKRQGHEPVNIGNSAQLTVLEFARQTIKATGSRGKIVYRPVPQNNPKRLRPDISRARELLGWEPRMPLAEGLVKTIDCFQGRV